MVLSSIVGSVVAGLLLGTVEAYTIGLISSKFSDTIVFLYSWWFSYLSQAVYLARDRRST